MQAPAAHSQLASSVNWKASNSLGVQRARWLVRSLTMLALFLLASQSFAQPLPTGSSDQNKALAIQMIADAEQWGRDRNFSVAITTALKAKSSAIVWNTADHSPDDALRYIITLMVQDAEQRGFSANLASARNSLLQASTLTNVRWDPQRSPLDMLQRLEAWRLGIAYPTPTTLQTPVATSNNHDVPAPPPPAKADVPTPAPTVEPPFTGRVYTPQANVAQPNPATQETPATQPPIAVAAQNKPAPSPEQLPITATTAAHVAVAPTTPTTQTPVAQPQPTIIVTPAPAPVVAPVQASNNSGLLVPLLCFLLGLICCPIALALGAFIFSRIADPQASLFRIEFAGRTNTNNAPETTISKIDDDVPTTQTSADVDVPATSESAVVDPVNDRPQDESAATSTTTSSSDQPTIAVRAPEVPTPTTERYNNGEDRATIPIHDAIDKCDDSREIADALSSVSTAASDDADVIPMRSVAKPIPQRRSHEDVPATPTSNSQPAATQSDVQSTSIFDAIARANVALQHSTSPINEDDVPDTINFNDYAAQTTQRAA